MLLTVLISFGAILLPFVLDSLLPFLEKYSGKAAFSEPKMLGQPRPMFEFLRQCLGWVIAVYLGLLIASSWYIYIRKLPRNHLYDSADPCILVTAGEQSPLHVHDMGLLQKFPYQINPYLPLNYWFYGLGQSPHALSFVRARFVGFVFVVATCLFIYLICRKLRASRAAAFVAVNVVFMGSPTVVALATALRPDLLAVGFLVAAFYCYLLHIEAPRRSSAFWFLLTLLLAGAAMAVKLYPWASIVLIGLMAIARRRWDEVAGWAVWLGALVVALIAWNHWTNGGFLRHAVLSQSHLMQYLPLQHEFSSDDYRRGISAPPYALMLGWTIYVAVKRGIRGKGLEIRASNAAALPLSGSNPQSPIPNPLLLATWVFLAAVIPIPLMMKWGSNNYYYELACATAVAASVLLSQGVNIGSPSREQIVGFIVGILVVALIAVSMTAQLGLAIATSSYGRMFGHGPVIAPSGNPKGASPGAAQSAPSFPSTPTLLRERFQGKSVLASHRTMIALANAGATIAVNDPAFFNVQFVAGNFDEHLADTFRNGVAHGQVDYLVLHDTFDNWCDGDPKSFKDVSKNEASLYYFQTFLANHFQLDFVIEDSDGKAWYVYRNSSRERL
jgi:hypothetical protein